MSSCWRTVAALSGALLVLPACRAGDQPVSATLPVSDADAAAATMATPAAPQVDDPPAPALPLLPLDHLTRVARHPGFGGIDVVGTRTLLLGCHRIAVLTGHATKVVRLAPEDGGDDDCIAPIASDDTRLFFGRGDNTVTAFDAVAGRVVWTATHDLGERAAHLVVEDAGAIAGTIIAFPTPDGNVVAYDRVSGTMVWRTPQPDGRGVSLVTAGGRVVDVSRKEPVLRARDAASGAVVWQTPLAIDGAQVEVLDHALAADSAEIALLASAPSEGGVPVPYVLLFDASTGALRARNRIEGLHPMAASLVFAGAGLYAQDDATLLRLERATGATRWTATGELSEPVADGDALFVGAAGVQLVALDPSSGAVRWTYGVARRNTPVIAEVQPRWALDPDHAGAKVLAAAVRVPFAAMQDETHDEVSFFARGPRARPERTVTVSGVYLAAPPPETPDPDHIPEALTIGATRVPLQRDGTFHATLTGRGVALVALGNWHTALQAIDLDDARSSYDLVLHAPGYDQTCR